MNRNDFEYSRILLEQYKALLLSAEGISNRRIQISALFIICQLSTMLLLTINVGFVINILFRLFGIAISYLWIDAMNRYSQNNSVKFILAGELEKELAAKVFDKEYYKLKEGEAEGKPYKATASEKLLASLFAATHVAQLTYITLDAIF